jgi:hypothetical protein
MRKMLVVVLAIAFAGCGGDNDNAQAPDPKDQAMARRPQNISSEFVKKLVSEIQRDYPPTGHDIWTLVNETLAHPDTVSEAVLQQRLTQTVLKALREKAENIFAVVFIGRDPPGTDDLKFAVINRTGRDVSSLKGVIQVCSSSGIVLHSLKLDLDKPISAAGQLDCGGHWAMPSGLVEKLAEKDNGYKLQFVVSTVTFSDGTVEEYP